jgi:TATA-binding protein-associated factor
VNVFRLVTKNTLEEKIMKLQETKTSMAESIVNRDNSSLQDLDTSQLLDLFQVDSQQDSMEVNNNNSYNNEAESMSLKVGGGAWESIVKSLPDLWEEEQYTSEFNWNQFVQSIPGSQQEVGSE